MGPLQKTVIFFVEIPGEQVIVEAQRAHSDSASGLILIHNSAQVQMDKESCLLLTQFIIGVLTLAKLRKDSPFATTHWTTNRCSLAPDSPSLLSVLQSRFIALLLVESFPVLWHYKETPLFIAYILQLSLTGRLVQFLNHQLSEVTFRSHQFPERLFSITKDILRSATEDDDDDKEGENKEEIDDEEEDSDEEENDDKVEEVVKRTRGKATTSNPLIPQADRATLPLLSEEKIGNAIPYQETNCDRKFDTYSKAAMHQSRCKEYKARLAKEGYSCPWLDCNRKFTKAA